MGNGATGRSEPLTPLAEDREEWWSADQRGSAPRDRRPPRSRPGSERRGRASTMAPPPEPPRSAPRPARNYLVTCSRGALSEAAEAFQDAAEPELGGEGEAFTW